MTGTTVTVAQEATTRITLNLKNISDDPYTTMLVCGITPGGVRRWWKEKVGQTKEYSFTVRPSLFEKIQLTIFSRDRAPVWKEIVLDSAPEPLAVIVDLPKMQTIKLNVWLVCKYSSSAAKEYDTEVVEQRKEIAASIAYASDLLGRINPLGVQFKLDGDVHLCDENSEIAKALGLEVASIDEIGNLPRVYKPARDIVNVYVVPGVYHRWPAKPAEQKSTHANWKPHMTHVWEENEPIEVRGRASRATRNVVYISSRIALRNTLAHELGHSFGLNDLEQGDGGNLMRLPNQFLTNREVEDLQELTLGQMFRMRYGDKSWIKEPHPGAERPEHYPPLNDYFEWLDSAADENGAHTH